MKNLIFNRITGIAALGLLAAIPSAFAEEAPPSAAAAAPAAAQYGSISGRVLNGMTGQYLNNAVVSVVGSDLVVYTDETGSYRFPRVPVGENTVEVSFTGMEKKRSAVSLAADGSEEVNFELSGTARDSGGEVVQLETFIVSSQPMEGSAIALQEQRVAPNLKKVVSADEFGLVPDGNIGEFLKLMPGIVMSNRGGDPREIIMNGAPSSSVPITVDGFGLASTEISGTGRNVELNNTSINTLARIETVMSVTPDTPASALAGTVNLVPRNAFERSKPEFKGTMYLNWRDTTADFYRSKGPRREPTFKVLPGFELSWVVPVNRNFGFTVSAGASTQYLENSTVENTWRGAGAVTTGTGLPDTTPDKPYMSDFLVGVQSKVADRSSLALTADYRLAPGNTLSFGFQFGTLHTDFSQRNVTISAVRQTGQAASRPVEYGPTRTRGGVGKGMIQSQTGANNRYTQTWMPTLRYRFKGNDWAADMGVGYSRAQNLFRSVSRGIMQTTTSQRQNVTVVFDDIGSNYVRPGSITVLDGTTGAVVDPWDISSYVLNNSNGNEQTKESSILTAFASVERRFDWHWPIAVKLGFQVDESTNDNKSKSTGPLGYVGADGVASTAPSSTSDDGSAQFYDANFYQRVYLFDVPRISWVDNESAYESFAKNPKYWTTNANTAYRNEVSASKYSREIVSAPYLRGDIDLFNRRLHLNGGLRAEQTNIKALGPLTDPTLNYQRDSGGNVLYDSAGSPLLIVPTTDALGVSKLTYLARGSKVNKEYLRLFPSVNARYSITDSLFARAAYYKSIGRPDFSQYSGGITLPNLEQSPSSSNVITVNNAAIKPWTADTVRVSLEYYFPAIGNISVGAFRRDFKNFFGSARYAPTQAFLDLYGLDIETYGRYDVVTQTNLPDTLHTEGMEIDYKQALTFLPNWARGFQVFGNISWLCFRDYDFNSGSTLAIDNFSYFVPRTINYGVSFTRRKFTIRLNCNMTSRTRDSAITGRSIEAGTYTWKTERTYYDLSGEYTLTKNFALFGSVRNVNDEVEAVEAYGPSTPSSSVFRSQNAFGAYITLGVKGRF